MATVYLATDRKHQRQVAIKVLRPELGATVGPERFGREIAIAARLQHPHILPLFESGEAQASTHAATGTESAPGTFLYYVMPYVEGETLRDRLARGPVPVPEATRLLAEMADALAAAHAAGIVHRDIKPENVMLSGRHALVMDFGVAHAVSEATSDHRMTSVGMALGTPSYMAPEQAAADPLIDHRADLYALGIVGYEMLTGRSPYEATTPQQMLSAHITQPPRPITALRPDLPPDLAAAIMRCLEKEREDRWPTADALRSALEQLASGSSTPIEGIPPVRAVAPPHPIRAALLFALGGFVLLALVGVLVQRLGLPDWVITVTQLLLLAGLPVAVAIAIAERRRAAEKATGTWRASGETGMQRLMTWRRARQGGATAFLGLGLAAAAYTGMRVMGIGPVGTLLGRGSLHDQDRVVVSDFTSRGVDSSLAATVSEALRIDLSQTPVVRVLDAGEVRSGLLRMGRPEGATRLDPATARELALREGAKAYLVGEVSGAGRGFLLTVRLLATESGDELVGLRETAADDTEVLKAIDRLSKHLRERLGESLRDIRAAPPLEQVTTNSLQALRLFSEARTLLRTGTPPQTEQLLRQAVELDSGFATAWRALGVYYFNTGSPRSKQIEAATQAFTHRNRLPELERLNTEAYYYSSVARDNDQAERAYRAILARRPQSPAALNNLSLIYARRRQWAAAETLLVRGLSVDSTLRSFHVNLVENLARQHKVPEAIAANARMARLVPNAGVVLAANQWSLLAMQGEFDSAAAVAAAVLPSLTRPTEREWTASTLAAFAARKGHAEEALRLLRSAELAVGSEAASRLQQAIYRADGQALLGGSFAEGIRILDQALLRDPLTTMPLADRPYQSLINEYAFLGRADRARQLYSEMNRADTTHGNDPSWGQYALGWVEVAEGKYASGLARIRSQADSAACFNCSRYYLAWAYDRAGEHDSTRVILERTVNAAPEWEQYYDDSINLARAYQRLGELYEAKGDRAKALDYYGRLVEQWRDADAPLQSVLRDIKARMARLTGG